MLDWQSFYLRAGLAFGIGSLVFIHSLWFHWHQNRQGKRVVVARKNNVPWRLWVLFSLLPFGFVTPILSCYAGTVFTFAGFFIALFGLLLTCFARHSLGRFWSHRVEVIEGHRWKSGGVYHVLAHPVYFGEFLIAFGTVLLSGHLFALVYMWAVRYDNKEKGNAEEQLLTLHLGPRPSEPLTRQLMRSILLRTYKTVPQSR